MTQTDLFIAMPPNPFRQGSQNDRVYRRLARYGRVTNVEIMYGLGGSRIMNTTGRASDVRRYLEPFGVKLHCNEVKDGVFEYSIQ